MDNSLFRRLSPELRNMIYKDVLTTDEGITLDCTDTTIALSATPTVMATASLPCIALTQTCHEIRQETRKMYYSINRLTIITSASTGRPDAKQFPRWEVRSNVNAFQRLVGKDQLAQFRKVQLTIQARKDAQRALEGSYKLSMKMLRAIRGLFSPAAKFELRLDMGAIPFYQLELPVVRSITFWDVDVNYLDKWLHAPGYAVLHDAERFYTLPVHPDPVVHHMNVGMMELCGKTLSRKLNYLVCLGEMKGQWM